MVDHCVAVGGLLSLWLSRQRVVISYYSLTHTSDIWDVYWSVNTDRIVCWRVTWYELASL